MDAIEALKTRRSVRAYKTDPVPAKIVEDIVDCGRLAASGRNEQPWEFIAVTRADTRRQLTALAKSGQFLAQTPVCLAVFCKDTKYYLEDGSAAMQNMLVAAHAHGLGACWVAGDKKPYAAQIGELLGVPRSNKLIGLIGLGYPAEQLLLPPKRALRDVLHWEKF